MAVKKGDKVKMDYTGKLEDGTVFDTSKHEDHSHPLEFQVGENKIIKGLEEQVVGMEKDEEKQIKVPKDKAYGDRNEQLIVDIPKEKLPKDKEVKPGMMLLMSGEDGKQMPSVVLEVGDESVKIDLNHPLAGRDLFFDVKILEIQENNGAEEDSSQDDSGQSSEGSDDSSSKE